MLQLCLLMMCQFLVTFATSDIAVLLYAGSTHLHLDKDDLNMMHTCLCNSWHSSCRLDATTESVTSLSYGVTGYSNRYTCSLFPGSINCTRIIHNDQQEAAIKYEGKSFSLHDNKTCDINCVDVVMDDTVNFIFINPHIISDELCAARQPSSTQNMKNTNTPCSTQNMMNTKLIIVIAAESSFLIAFIISVIIAVYVRIKRKRRVQKTIDTINLDTGIYLEVYNTGGLNDVESTDTSSSPYLDLLQEPHYQEIGQDRPDRHQSGEKLSKI
ncbi:hypothetical protein BsWGS_25352 [Bradybaena similaris]